MTLHLRVAVGAACGVLAALANAQVMDGGFENVASGGYTGSLGDGWTVTSGVCVVYANGDESGVVAHGGSQYLDLDVGYSTNTVEQDVATTVGGQYSISFWLASDVTTSAMETFGGTTLFSGTVPIHGLGSPSDYTFYSFNVSASSTATALAFSSAYTYSGSGFGVTLDDVAESAVPEPGPALASGGAILWLLLRSRLTRRLGG